MEIGQAQFVTEAATPPLIKVAAVCQGIGQVYCPIQKHLNHTHR